MSEGSGDSAVIVVENGAVRSSTRDVTVHDYLDTCPLCLRKLHSREPKLLPCLHSFCKRCFPSPSRNLATTEQRSAKPLNVIRCPVCRQECMEVDVMDNVFVKDSLEAPSSTVEKPVQLCMTCSDNMEAAGFCVDCVEYLCRTCVDAHQRVKFTKDHTIRQKADISQDIHSVSAQRPMFCNVHKQEPLKLFCETCDLLTCRDCQLVKHKDHTYQFLEDAYENHKQQMDSMSDKLQEKKKLIEEVSNSINNGLAVVEQNRASIQTEIKKSICSLIVEINKKGEMLINQLQAVTKDHESVLRKQQEDIGYLSRHLDHVINFTKWATARSRGTALLHCKRLILFQIGNLLRAKCSASFIPQCTVRFQCRASYWASNVDLGSLVVESVPGHQLGNFLRTSHQLSPPRLGPLGSPHSFAPRATHSTLAQLQLQVDKLNPQEYWQAQPPPPHWTWYQTVPLQRSVPGPLQKRSPSHTLASQPGRRFIVPPPNHVSPNGSLQSPRFSPQQPQRGMGSSSSLPANQNNGFSSSPSYTRTTPVPISGATNLPQSQQMMEAAYVKSTRNETTGSGCNIEENSTESPAPVPLLTNRSGVQNCYGYTAVSQEEKMRIFSWEAPERHQGAGALESAVRKRRRSSAGPVIVIKDEPDDNSYDRGSQKPSLPDSTDDQPNIRPRDEENYPPAPLHSTNDRPHSLLQPPCSPWNQSKKQAPNQAHSVREEQQLQQNEAGLGDSNEALCAVCQMRGEMLRCHKCHKVFHPHCHIPTLLKYPSGNWFCSFCRDLLVPDVEYNIKPEAKALKTETDIYGGFSPEDKQKCERLLLHLFCSELSSDFQEPMSPSVCANNRLTIKGPMSLSTVKKHLETKPSLCYRSSAEFVSDIRLILENYRAQSEANSKIDLASKKLQQLFEDYLKLIYPDQIFPEIKLEKTSPHSQHSHLSSADSIPQLAQ
ncbi:transcription intermediary factor 1-alpha-like [Pholidichthys leucotaenia]